MAAFGGLGEASSLPMLRESRLTEVYGVLGWLEWVESEPDREAETGSVLLKGDDGLRLGRKSA